MSKQAILFSVALAVSGSLAFAQETTLKIPAQPISADNGKEMYEGYCAPCHGVDGRGDGAQSATLKLKPTDLTQLSKHNNGVYPSKNVTSVLKFGTKSTTHGSKGMPVWGPALQKVDHAAGGNSSTHALRINNIVKYIETLQAK